MRLLGRFFSLILLTEALNTNKWLELFPKHQLNLWERRCLETHNKIRYAYGIDSVRWNTLFSDLAKDRAFNTLTTKKSSSGSIRRPLPLFQAGDVSFKETDDVTSVPVQVILNPGLFPGFLADKVERLLYRWWMSAYFNETAIQRNPPLIGNYETMVNAEVKKIGCGLKVQVISAVKININFVVAYYHNKKQFPSNHTQVKMPKPHPDRSCESHCEGSCCSLNFPDDASSSRCNCSKSIFLTSSPLCEGNCFVFCPRVKDTKLQSCYGKARCSCSYARAICS